MERNKRVAPTVWRLVCALLFLVLLSMRLGVGVPARYSSSANGSDSARVAVFASDIVQQDFDITDMIPGRSDTVSVTVANYQGIRVCEVKQQYKISATVEGDLPITVAVYTDEACTQPAANLDGNGNVVGIFAPVVKASETYYIKALWDEDDNSYAYANGIGVVVVTVTAVQVD